MPRTNWRYINERIGACRRQGTPSEVISCLKDLFEETGDGMAAFALAEELEKVGDFIGAEKYYMEAENRFPLPDFKRKAAQALERLSSKPALSFISPKKTEGTADLSSGFMTVIDLMNYDPASTLFVVSCTKKKIWDRSPSAPEFVPARYAYIGDSYLRFTNWADEQQIERRGFKWVILSGKYGFIEPWHPIGYYDIPIDDDSCFPVTNDFLRNQVKQVRWYKNPDGRWAGYNLNQFDRIVCVNCGQTYQNRVQICFSDKSIERLDI